MDRSRCSATVAVGTDRGEADRNSAAGNATGSDGAVVRACADVATRGFAGAAKCRDSVKRAVPVPAASCDYDSSRYCCCGCDPNPCCVGPAAAGANRLTVADGASCPVAAAVAVQA